MHDGELPLKGCYPLGKNSAQATTVSHPSRDAIRYVIYLNIYRVDLLLCVIHAVILYTTLENQRDFWVSQLCQFQFIIPNTRFVVEVQINTFHALDSCFHRNDVAQLFGGTPSLKINI